MFPAICRGKALKSYGLAAVTLLSACASTGPGTPASFATPGIMPARVPATIPQASARKPSAPISSALKSSTRKPSVPKVSTPKPRVSAPARPRTARDSAAMESALTRQLAHRPLAAALARRTRNPELADRVASAVVYEAGRAHISPSVLAAVLLIENAPFDTSAVSSEGAIGLMQVMPMHVGNYRCLSGDLLNVEANICHGARLLQMHLRRTKSLEAALRRYNGCVRGRNTPRCQMYPVRVMRTASRLRREILIAGAKLSDQSGEDPEDVAARLDALPPDLPADSATVAANEPARCDSFLGCLRDRWSRTR
jgi:soluble lytic murein transglycosylase-like protein